MHRKLRRAVLFFGGAGHGQAGGFFASVAVTADAEGGPGCGFAQGFADAQAIQRAHGVGGKVDVGADAGELLRLFEDDDALAELEQCNGGGKTADATAADADEGFGHDFSSFGWVWLLAVFCSIMNVMYII